MRNPINHDKMDSLICEELFMSDYNEEAYENALIELFQNMGWEHVYGPDIERDWHSPLYDSIRRLNPKATPTAINEALLKLRNFENAELKKKNAIFMEYLQNGKELTETLRKNKTIDWQKKESARAKMRILVKRLLKKYKYPPEGQEDALKTVISQCEL